jgi:hypothetical protein
LREAGDFDGGNEEGKEGEKYSDCEENGDPRERGRGFFWAFLLGSCGNESFRKIGRRGDGDERWIKGLIRGGFVRREC